MLVLIRSVVAGKIKMHVTVFISYVMIESLGY
jgi:hypothetical protein